jgi:hypothetical protein
VGSQYNQNTPGQVVQVQATPDADIDYAEHRSSVADTAKLAVRIGHYRKTAFWEARE